MAHLWTEEPAPLEYIELIMCRDVYHCAPRDLPPWYIIRRHLAIMEVEADVRKRRQKAKK